MASGAQRRVSSAMRHGVGTIVLNRPEAINAIDLDMVQGIRDALEGWRDEPDVQTVVLAGEGERGFCAGGDVRTLYQGMSDGDPSTVLPFFLDEYALDAAIADYPKPIVAFADGVTMGGGLGLAGGAKVRVATETTRMAMPETRIGFSPDASGSWQLAHAPGRLGEYLALTSDSVDASDAIHARLADHFVPRDRLEAVQQALETRADPARPSEIVMLFDETPEPGPLQAAQPWIDEAFSADTVAEIIDRLQNAPAVDGPITPAGTLAALAERSPTALTIALAAIRSARALPSVRHALVQEYHLMHWFLTQPDMPEGIRAQMIDKDRSPKWQPATLAEVPEDIVGVAFAHRAPQPLFPDLES
ncbi:MAG: enoyl-CoA hydratase/isomerase family protein [Microbacterium sp.]